MTYLTSWDINCILCLVTMGLPDDLVKMMMKTTKKTHEAYSLKEAMDYWISNSPTLVKSRIRSACPGFTYMFNSSKLEEHDRECRKEAWYQRRDNILEFKRGWRLRSIEERHKKVIDWCKLGSEYEQQRHRQRLKDIRNKRQRWEDSPNYYGEEYINNLWQSWDVWSHCDHPPMIYDENTVRPQPWHRRVYISQWYEGIHPGRFFLFYKENKIIEERSKGLPKGSCEDGYRYPQTPIFDKGPYEQLIEDLRCIDGPGLGEIGTKVEHIDDLFI